LREEAQLVWEDSRERVEVLSRLLYDQLVLEETRRLPGEPELADATRVLLEHAEGIPDPDQLARLKARIALVAEHCPESKIAKLDDAQVRGRLADLARGLTSLRELRELDVLSALTPPQLNHLAPQEVALPTGRKLRVEYAEGQPPAVRSRLQDFFGMARGPAICADACR